MKNKKKVNIEKFNKCAAEIFSLLYEHFPIPNDINLTDYPHYDNQENNTIFFATIDFLNEENFIRYQKKVYGGYLGVVLTSKGFTVLNSPLPKAITGNKTIGSKLKDIVKTGKDESIKILIREAIKLSLLFFQNIT